MAINRTKVLEVARKHLSKGQFDKAIAQYEKLIKSDRRDVRSLHKIGEIYQRKGDKEQAVDTYRKVVELYAEQGFFLKALAVCKQALKVDPTRFDLMVRLGDMYEQLQLITDAMATYGDVANAFLQAGETDRALGMLAKMAELDPDHIPVRIKYAEALSRAGRTQLAADEFEKSAAQLKEQGRIEDYIKVAERLLYHRHNDVNIARDLAEAYLARKDPKRALAKLQICFKADTRDTRTLEQLADAFLQLGQADKAMSVYMEIARIHREAGRTADRVAVLERILKLSPSHTDAKRALESTLAALPQQPDTAQEVARESGRPVTTADNTGLGFEPTEVDDRRRMPPPRPAPAPPPGLGPITFAEFEAIPLTAEEVESEDPRLSWAPSVLESTLEEADYFITTGEIERAKAAIAEMQKALAHHPLVLDKAREIESLTNGSHEKVVEDTVVDLVAPPKVVVPPPIQSQSPKAAEPLYSKPSQPFYVKPPPPAQDQSFDLAEKLAGGVDLQPPDQEMVDVDAIFDQFKKGVAEQIRDDDSETHFDLGIAYKEMGLFDDARREFQVAMSNAHKECLCHTMVGLCFMEESRFENAIEAFKSGLASAYRTEAEDLGLHFELGRAYQKAGMVEEARRHFERVQTKDPRFRKVTERLQALSSEEQTDVTGRLSTFDELFRDD